MRNFIKIVESLTTATTIEWIFNYKAHFEVDGQGYIVEFNPFGINQDIRKVIFRKTHSQSYRLTNKGTPGRVFSGVFTAIDEYIKREKPKRLMFGSEKDERSRLNLYSIMAQKFKTRFPNYKMSEYEENENSALHYWVLDRISKRA